MSRSSATIPITTPEPRGFGGHLIAQAAGAMNDNLFRQAFQVAVTLNVANSMTGVPGSDPDILAGHWKNAMVLVFILPFLFLAPLAGRLADTMPKHRLIRRIRLAEIAICCIAGGALVTGSVWLMLLALALLGIQSALFSAVKLAVVPELVRSDQLETANGWLIGSTYLAIMLGTGLAFTADETIWQDTALADMPSAMILWLVSLVIATTGAVAAYRIPPLAVGSRVEVRATFGEQFAALRSADGLWPAALALGASWGIGIMAQIALSGIAVNDYQLTEAGAALLALVPSLGIALGALVAPRLSHRAFPGGLPILGAIGAGIGMLLMASTAAAGGGMSSGIVGLFLAGLGIACWTVPLNIFLQYQSPIEQRGRVFAAAGILSICCILLGAGINSAVLHWVGGSTAVMAAAGAIAIAGACACAVTYRFHLCTWAATMLTRLCYRVRVQGAHHLPSSGGCLVICNHLSYADGVVLFASLPRPARFLVYRRYVEMRLLGFPLRAAGVIPVDGGGSRQALLSSIDNAVAAAQAGEVVVIFPEGKVTRSGQMDRFQAGMERIAKRADIPIIPAYLHGLYGSLSSRADSYRGPWIRRRVDLRLGPPLPTATPAQEARAMVRRLGFEEARERSARDQRCLASATIQAMRRSPGQTVVTDAQGSLTRQQLCAAARACSGMLDLGEDERRVGVLLPPGRAGAIVNLALAMLGRTAVNLNHTVGAAGMAGMIELAGVRTVITAGLYHRKIGAPELPGRVLQVEDLLKGMSALRRLRGLLAVRLLPTRWLCRARPDDIAALVFSSGSTSTPKGIQLSHRQILANCAGTIDHLGLHNGDHTVLCPLPLFHSFGLTVGTWLPLVSVIAVANHPDPTDASGIGKLAESSGADFFVATPTFVRGWMRRIEPQQFASLRFGVVGAEKCTEDLRSAFREKYDAELLEGYGATELGPVVSVNTLDTTRDGVTDRGSQPGSVGRPLPGIDVLTLDPETREPLPAGEEGLLVIRSPARMAGYLDRDDLTEAVFVHDGYDTGDIGHVDRDGFIHLTGRLSRFAKIGGEMVPLDRVEEALAAQLPDEDDNELAVAAVPDQRRGERLVVLHTAELDPDALLAAVELPKLFTPKASDFHKVDSLPTLGTGKRDLRRLKELAAEIADG